MKDKILYKGTWWVHIKKKFLFNTNLSQQARFLFIILLSFTNDKRPSAFPSINYLSDILCLSTGSVKKYLKELSDKCYIKSKQVRNEKGEFFHNLYSLYEEPYNSPKYKNCTTVNEPQYKKTVADNLTTNNNQLKLINTKKYKKVSNSKNAKQKKQRNKSIKRGTETSTPRAQNTF